MKIAVLVKQTPDTETKATLGANGLDLSQVKFILNPYDEFAIEEAIKWRDKFQGEAIVVSLGPDRVIPAMRKGLEMGCDSALHLKTSEEETAALDSYATAKCLAEALKQNGPFDLVFAGKQAIDDDALAVPQMVAEFLEIPRATVVSQLEIADDKSKLTAKRAIDGGAEEIIEMPLPALVAANKGLNKPRYPAIPQIMKAKKKPVTVVELSTLGVGTGDSKVSYSDFELPAEKQAGQKWTGTPEELAQKIVHALRNEAKVI